MAFTALVAMGGWSANSPLAAQSFHPALNDAQFPVPESLAPNVRFWYDIFAKHSSSHGVVHDDREIQVIFEVLDFSALESSSASAATKERNRDRTEDKAIDRYSDILRWLGGDQRTKVDAARAERVRALYVDVPGGREKFREAARRVRVQSGLRDRFGEAIEVSGMFMPGIERTLKEQGLPIEIRCMPFVESMFNYKARSKVGASGAWQFTRSTGRLFLQIDSAVDARSDVLLAADGAARYLAKNYEKVKSWPLALTGYNHGIAGMQRAVRRLGTRDIGVISEKYRSRTFGFASRNFYAEFVAAVMVFAEKAQLFPNVVPRAELRFDEFVPPKYVSLKDLLQVTKEDLSKLKELNPALRSEVFSGQLLVPPRYPLRVPAGALSAFQDAFDRIPQDRKRDRQLATRYKVRRGDTLGRVARKFGSSIRALQRANGLPRADRIYIGQILEIPTGGSLGPLKLEPARASTPPRVADGGEHTVRKGETLSQIAESYGVSIATLISVNSLGAPDRLRVGQRLAVPARGGDSAPPTYKVRRGDTLIRIASVHGITVRSLMSKNGLTSTLIRVGQILRIPS